jgi:anaerobic magnesium-protoporphyrin IX monomethyl ester cyclase
MAKVPTHKNFNSVVRMTNILLVNVLKENRVSPKERIYSSLGTAYLASYLKKYGNLADVQIIEGGQSLTAKKLSSYKPDIVGISSVTQNIDIAFMIAKQSKILNALTVIGGHHASALPESVTKYVDVAVIGEGEQTFLELVDKYLKYGRTKFNEVDGIAYREEGHFLQTKPRNLIHPLDNIPYPARELLPTQKSHYLLTSRGCPYSCVFCSSSSFWHGIRFHSPKYVVGEIKHLADTYKIHRLNLYDDLFIANLPRLEEIVQLLRAEHLHERIEFSCLARSNLVTNQVATLLKRMNVINVALGLESGCEKTLRYLKGSSVTVGHNYRAVRILKHHKFAVTASFVIGSPSETWEDALETLRFLQQSPIDSGETYVLTPYPATPVWHDAVAQGFLSEESVDWRKSEIYFEDMPDSKILVAQKLNRQELSSLMQMFKVVWKEKAQAYRIQQQSLPVLVSRGFRKVRREGVVSFACGTDYKLLANKLIHRLKTIARRKEDES